MNSRSGSQAGAGDLLELVRSGRAVTRGALQQATGLSRATVGQRLDRLEGEIAAAAAHWSQAASALGATRQAAASALDSAVSALIAELGPDEFLVTGMPARVTIHPVAASAALIYDRVEGGRYVDGQWRFARNWNGDQTDYGLNFSDAVQLLRVTLATYRTTHDVDRGAQAP